jgi:opacity protein-like surface antigen
MRQLIFAISMASALAWSGAAVAVVDEEKEVPVTGTDIPNATLVITDRSTGKTISTSKVTDGKTHISIHEQQLNRKSKVIVTLKNEKGETIKNEKGEPIERRDITLGWIFQNGIALNTQGGRSSESGRRQALQSTHHISGQPRSSSVVMPATAMPQPYRSWQFGLGGDLGAGTTRNKDDDVPAFASSGGLGGGHFDARFYFLPNAFVGFNAGILASSIKGDDPDTGAFANYRWQATEMGQIGMIWTPPGTATPVDIYGGIGLTQGSFRVGFVSLESTSKTLDGLILRAGWDIFVVPNFAIGMSYSYSQFSGTIGGDPVKTQINTFLVSATYYFPGLVQ